MKRKPKKIVRKKTSHKKRHNAWQMFSMLVFIFVAALCITLFLLTKNTSQTMLKIASSQPRQSLQIGTFYITPTSYTAPTVKPFLSPATKPSPTFRPAPSPTPPQSSNVTCGIANGIVLITGSDQNGNCCVEDGPGKAPATCCPGVGQSNLGPHVQFPDAPPGTEFWCNAKPVIYLYPEQPTLISVSVKVPGQIFVSIPSYPTHGWKNILAHPDGTLTYQGKDYTELFYESSITPIAPPAKGFVIFSDSTEHFLRDFTSKLGLRKHESNELISYWLPKLQGLDSPYLFVSVFDPLSKDKIDHVEITPKPNTFIAFILYFKPLKEFRAAEPLPLPVVPIRTGFTAVEWGGIIDTN